MLELLRVYLKTFTLGNVIAEIERWRQAGESCFSMLLQQLKMKAPSQSILDELIPIPDGYQPNAEFPASLKFVLCGRPKTIAALYAAQKMDSKFETYGLRGR